MDTTLSQKHSTASKKRLTRLLTEGRESTKLLDDLVRRGLRDDGSVSVSVSDLVKKITGSFSDSLSELGLCDSGEFSHLLVGGNAGGDSSGHRELSGKKPKPAPAGRAGRGSYKRRRTEDSRIEIAETDNDGHAWRKYGQKEILNAKFPRCYYRCTFKTTQKCKAKKQVQQLGDGSNKYHITYLGNHTCQTMQKASQMFQDSESPNSIILNFEDSKAHLNFHPHPPSTPSTITNTHIAPSVKKDDASKAQSDDISDNLSSASYGQSAPTSWEMVCPLEPSHGTMLGFDHELDSCASTSPNYLDMEFFKINSGSFAGDVHFDELEFLPY